MKNEAKGAELPGKSGKTMIGLIIAIVAVVAIVGYKMIGPRAIVNVEDCYSVEFTGTDGDGIGELTINSEMIHNLIAEGLSASKSLPFASNGTYEGEKADEQLAELMRSFAVNLDDNCYLSNGDRVRIWIIYDEDLAKELRVKFINTEKTIEVSGLENPQYEK